MTLPDLHGWATARMLARRLGVRPDTVRARARRGVLERVPNPLGPGALYRSRPPDTGGDTGKAPKAERTEGNPASVKMRGLRSDDGYALTLLPATTARVASELGVSDGAAWKTLGRLERAGLARRGGTIAPGRQGGRPAQMWEARS